MITQVNHDNHIQGSAELTSKAQALVQDQLSRFTDQVTRIEIHLSDEDGTAKSAPDDKRCLMEARPAGMQPISVSHRGSTVDEALQGATDKMESLLESTFGKLNHR